MISTLKKSVYKHGYLLITAAWLYTLSFLIGNYWSYTSSPERIKSSFERFLQKTEKKFTVFAADTNTLASIILNRKPPPKKLYNEKEINFYVYTKNDIGNYLLNFWSSNIVSPQIEDVQRPDGKYFVRYLNGEFEFIKQSIFIRGRAAIVVGMIPIRWSNYLSTYNYQNADFATFADLEKRYQIDPAQQGFAINTSDGKPLFFLKEKDKDKTIRPSNEGLPLALKTIAIIFVLIFINFIAYDLTKRFGWLKGFTFLLVTIIFLRYLSYLFPFPFDFHKLQLFDPEIYASNEIHPSLGDLLINTILAFWLVSFLKYVAVAPLSILNAVKESRGRFLAFLVSVVMVVILFTCSQIIRSLIVDSRISFDVADFKTLTGNTFLSIIILCFMVLSFFHLSHVLLLLINKFSEEAWLKYVFVAVVGQIYLALNIDQPFLASNFIVLAWFMVYLFLLDKRPRDYYVPLIKSRFFLVWLIFFASSISSLIIYQNSIVEGTHRQKFAEDVARRTDPHGEDLLSLSLNYLSDDFFSADFYRFYNRSENQSIKDSLIKVNMTGYLNKYDTRIYTFDKNRTPLYNDDSISYEVITNTIYNQSKKTKVENLYYYENSTDKFSYLFQKQVKDAGNKTIGYIFVIAKPKGNKSETLTFELFRKVKDPFSDLNYTYAVYQNNVIEMYSGSYNFASQLDKSLIPKVESAWYKRGDYTELWYKASRNKIIVVVKKTSVFYEAITLFAYLFSSFLFIILSFHLGSFLFRSRFNWRAIKSSFKLNIKNQIQSTIIFISIFSFVVIGAATISFYISRFDRLNSERLVRAITIMAGEIQRQIANNAMFDDVSEIYDLGSDSYFENSLKEISEIHNVDVNFYDVNGVIKVSTQPYVYSNRVLSEMIDPVAFYRLKYNQEIQVIQKERVGLFEFLSIYVPLKNEVGETYAFLNIPYINSQQELNQEISNFLVTLINVNAFIFVLAGLIALLLTNRITQSFTLIAEKMRAINLGKYNEEIEWKGNDEIGALVNEYNTMVKKLEESALALAKSEREGAWREMARQVAHEIKNPLTPMKLSIQYLQKALNEDRAEMQLLAKRVSITLIEQIDQLAKIASDFSQFANLGNIRSEKFNVSDILESLVALHSTNNNIKINWVKPSDPVLINADKIQISRLFTNLIKNAIDATKEDEVTEINIVEKVDKGTVTISIADNGIGIPADKHDKIFVPNFTTKSSGTGLGLAICKGIVEQANGDIWFTTQEQKGTTFYVKFPIA